MKKECPFCPRQSQEAQPFVRVQGGSACPLGTPERSEGVPRRAHDIFAARRDESVIVGYYTFRKRWAPPENNDFYDLYLEKRKKRGGHFGKE